MLFPIRSLGSRLDSYLGDKSQPPNPPVLPSIDRQLYRKLNFVDFKHKCSQFFHSGTTYPGKDILQKDTKSKTLYPTRIVVVVYSYLSIFLVVPVIL